MKLIQNDIINNSDLLRTQIKNQGGFKPLSMEEWVMKKVHLEQDYWNDIPETSSLSYQYNHPSIDNTKWKAIRSNITPIICELILEFLTDRQYQVFNLYLLEHTLTQIQIGKILGISQPTVNQHLNGKIRNGKRIGGAINRIRKKIDTLFDSENGLTKYAEYLDIFEILLKKDS